MRNCFGDQQEDGVDCITDKILRGPALMKDINNNTCFLIYSLKPCLFSNLW